MSSNNKTVCILAVVLTVTSRGTILGSESSNKANSIKKNKIPQCMRYRFAQMRQALPFTKWPKSHNLRLVKTNELSSLLSSELNDDLIISFGRIDFWDDCWAGGNAICRCRSLAKNTKPLPTELPPELKERLLENVSTEVRNNPNLLEKYLDKQLQIYREAKMFVVIGQLQMHLCVSPSTEAAYEYLIYKKSLTSLPVQSELDSFNSDKKNKALGTNSFIDFPVIMVVRDNIAVYINARGDFKDKALSLAKKIDGLIQKQPISSDSELQARRPTIIVSSRAKKTDSAKQKIVPFNTSTPEGTEVININAEVDGKQTWIKGKKIYIIGQQEQRIRVSITATTNELLTNKIEKEVIVEQ